MGSNNFTFEATIADQCYGDSCVLEGEGRVGSLDGQQPIEVIVEGSTLVTFQDMRVLSVNGERYEILRSLQCLGYANYCFTLTRKSCSYSLRCTVRELNPLKSS